MTYIALENVTLEKELRRAIEEKELQVYYPADRCEERKCRGCGGTGQMASPAKRCGIS